MTAEQLPAETLRQIPMFDHLNDVERRQLAAAATLAQFKPGEDVIEQGGQCQNLWIVLEGECDVIKLLGEAPELEEVTLATLGPYENFGEMSFFHAAPHSAAVRARNSVKLLRLTREAYSELIDHGVGAAFKLAYNTVESLAQRLRRMDEWVAELITQGAKQDRVPEWKGFRQKLFAEWNL